MSARASVDTCRPATFVTPRTLPMRIGHDTGPVFGSPALPSQTAADAELDARLDEALDASFPASDPPAVHLPEGLAPEGGSLDQSDPAGGGLPCALPSLVQLTPVTLQLEEMIDEQP